ncbi:MAG TPA: DUF4336 domain-containing protein [Hyphomicrobiales bacterium]|nr:DUF4336 domain-containing protein [Hyphomicrobiales bacterium]
MTALERVSDGIWIAEGACVNFYGFAYPTRSVIVRLASGDLWIWSPIDLKPELKAAIDDVGPVRYLVSPNKLHHLYLEQWCGAYPEARLFGPKSVIEKRADLPFETPLDNGIPSDWGDEIGMVHFTGSPFLDEAVFFHHPSATVIMADLSENFSESFLQKHWSWWQRGIARLWGIVEGRGYAPLEWRLSFLKRAEARKARDTLLAWNPQRVIMAHGEWQRENGRQYLERSLAWLGSG